MIKGYRLAAARRMRKSPSVAERELWRLLRGRRLEGLKFRRQVPIGPYVADFLCHAHRLIVEADGPFHDPDADAVRDDWLRSKGFLVLRFPVSVICRHPEIVLQAIACAARDRPRIPGPFEADFIAPP